MAGTDTSPPLSEGVLNLRRALRRALLTAAVTTAAGTAVLAVVAGVLAGWPGVWGALIGAGLAFVFLGTTALTVALTAGRDPVVSGAAVMGAWLLKVVVALAVVGSLARYDFFNRPALLLGVLIGLCVTLWAEYRAVVTARVPYVEPR
jgi:hypothetical protein